MTEACPRGATHLDASSTRPQVHVRRGHRLRTSPRSRAPHRSWCAPRSQRRAPALEMAESTTDSCSRSRSTQGATWAMMTTMGGAGRHQQRTHAVVGRVYHGAEGGVVAGLAFIFADMGWSRL